MRKTGFVRVIFILAAFGTVLPVNLALAETPLLSLPIECVPGKTCFIQNYVDVDPSSGVGDYRCRKSSYDGHKGTDFRIMSIAVMKRGIGVLAAAPGVVKALRDGMRDRLGAGKIDPAVKGRECGNGLVIDHGDGWETQYCHMFKDSLIVKKGDRIKRGQRIGLVGLSGQTAFPHIHVTLRHNGKIIDPFSGVQAGKTKCGLEVISGSLWQKDLLAKLPYVSGQLLHMGFAQGAVQKERLMLKGAVPTPRSTKAPALVFYGQAINLLKGDQLRIRLTDPKGVMAHTLSAPMKRHKASYLLFAGKKRTSNAWPRGIYKGTFALLRNGKQVWEKNRTLTLH